jgi:hypothetical protein
VEVEVENIFHRGPQNIPFVVHVVSSMEEHVVNERVGKKVPKGHFDQILAFEKLGGVDGIGVHLDGDNHRLGTGAGGVGGGGDFHWRLEDDIVVAGIVVAGIVVAGIVVGVGIVGAEIVVVGVGGGGGRAAAARSSVGGAWRVAVAAAAGIVGTVVVDNGIELFGAVTMTVVVGGGTCVAGLPDLMLE